LDILAKLGRLGDKNENPIFTHPSLAEGRILSCLTLLQLIEKDSM
jgi:hypothetical protein